MISVALPVFNSRRIAWLPMESLCRQVNTFDWELIIYEDGLYRIGGTFFMSYEARLKEAGCVRVHYIGDNNRIPLPQKWVRIAKETSPESKAFVMCASDNYYHKWMVQDARIAIEQADWCIMPKGFFYDFTLNKVRFYHYNGLVGLTMVANTSMVRQFESSDLERGIDGWFSEQMRKIAHNNGGLLRCFMDGSDHYEGMLCTNGLNNISYGRVKYLELCLHPFYKTDVTLQEIVPEDIYLKLIALHESISNYSGI